MERSIRLAVLVIRYSIFAVSYYKKVETLENQMKAAKYQRELMFWQIYKTSDENVTDAKLRFFRSLPKADGEARKSQLVMAALLQRIHETCEKNKLSYWLDFGTLIGAIRHEGFIPWDDDIDIGMMRSGNTILHFRRIVLLRILLMSR